MARRVSPYFSKRRKFHHVYSDCSVGGQIEKHNKVKGAGGRPMCGICKAISRGKRKK